MEETLVEIEFNEQFTISHNQYKKWRNGNLIASELEVFPLKWYELEEFRLLLEKIGFKDIIISSDYKYKQHPTKHSQIITFEATKA